MSISRARCTLGNFVMVTMVRTLASSLNFVQMSSWYGMSTAIGCWAWEIRFKSVDHFSFRWVLKLARSAERVQSLLVSAMDGSGIDCLLREDGLRSAGDAPISSWVPYSRRGAPKFSGTGTPGDSSALSRARIAAS